MRQPEIIEINEERYLRSSARVVRNAFKTVALDFNLTTENNPTHPSFITTWRLREDLNMGVKFFGLFLEDKQIGFIAVIQADTTLYYIKRLAILFKYRHLGYGKRLMEFAISYFIINRGTKVFIGIINNHYMLKKWYKRLGFEEKSTRKFHHLPFTVCFMEREITT